MESSLSGCAGLVGCQLPVPILLDYGGPDQTHLWKLRSISLMAVSFPSSYSTSARILLLGYRCWDMAVRIQLPRFSSQDTSAMMQWPGYCCQKIAPRIRLPRYFCQDIDARIQLPGYSRILLPGYSSQYCCQKFAARILLP